ncbi:MAG TPA: hypothetical protein VM012_07355 [Flavitalea sp.]|nr:hypothetical protein [Flavitalea sp.]
MYRFVLAFILLLSIRSFAQTDTNKIVVYKDARLDLLVKKQIEINEVTTRSARRFIPGYRILVMSTNNRDKVQDAKTRIYKRYPELKTYMLWQAPFFKLKVGNFRERDAAEFFVIELKKIFPTGVYVLKDMIEVKPDIYDGN